MPIFCEIVNFQRICTHKMDASAGLPPSGENVRKWGAMGPREGLFEGLNRSGLRVVDTAYSDGGNVVIFAADGRAGEAAEHGELADVGESVGDGALEKAIKRRIEGRIDRVIGSQILIEGAEGGEKSLLLFGPCEGLGIVPGGSSLHHGERPVEQIAHVGDDLNGVAAGAVKVGEGLRGIFKSSRSAVSESGQSVTEQVALFVHFGNIAQVDAHGDEDCGPTLSSQPPCEWRPVRGGSGRAERMGQPAWALDAPQEGLGIEGRGIMLNRESLIN